jgi:hypothetical protein
LSDTFAEGVDVRPKKDRYPYTLYRKATKSGVFWYARFWNEATGKYDRTRSIGVLVEGRRERRREAEDAADAVLETLKQEADRANPLPTPASPPTAIADTPFVKYVGDFWTVDSKYVREKKFLASRLSLFDKGIPITAVNVV